ncbi:surface lipoprotein assembly modifier [Rhodobacter capsulatus]|uniref:surface lipoprotein assembly modifier n=1 Tax=Rhodobacter capsulatus TaxID=1061 RepID=UPI00402A0048
MRAAGRLALALAGGLAALSPAVAEDRLGIEEARALAVAAHRAHDAPLAAALARALLARDPKDATARMILASAYYATGRFERADTEGRTAYRDSSADPQRHDAAMIVAEAAFKQAQIGAARRWLRRAAYFAPDAAQRDLALRAFHGLEGRQKFTWHVRGSVTPMSNLNGGTMVQNVSLGPITLPLPGELQALSGLRTHLGAEASYRFGESPRALWIAGAEIDGALNRLSAEAQRQAPTARGSDYDFWSLAATLQYRAQPKGWDAPWDARLTTGHMIYGGEDLSNTLGLRLGKEFALSQQTGLRAEIGSERQFRLDDAEQSVTLQTLDVIYRSQTGPGQILLGGGLTDARSASAKASFQGAKLNLSYEIAKPKFGLFWQTDLGLESRDYDTGREDRALVLGVSAVAPKLQYMGFAPEIGLNYTRNRSNHILYDSREIGFSLGVKSVF